LDAGLLDYVGFYDKPFLKFDRLMETCLAFAPAGFRSFHAAIAGWLTKKLHFPREIHKGLQGKYKRRCVFLEHHESHAASAFFPSPLMKLPFSRWMELGMATSSLGRGFGNNLELFSELRFPHSWVCSIPLLLISAVFRSTPANTN